MKCEHCLSAAAVLYCTYTCTCTYTLSSNTNITCNCTHQAKSTAQSNSTDLSAHASLWVVHVSEWGRTTQHVECQVVVELPDRLSSSTVSQHGTKQRISLTSAICIQKANIWLEDHINNQEIVKVGLFVKVKCRRKSSAVKAHQSEMKWWSTVKVWSRTFVGTDSHRQSDVTHTTITAEQTWATTKTILQKPATSAGFEFGRIVNTRLNLTAGSDDLCLYYLYSY